MIKLSKEKSSLVMFSVPLSLVISNEPTLNLNVYIKYTEGEKEKTAHFLVEKLVQGYTLIKFWDEYDNKYLLDIELFSEICKEAKKELPDFDALHTKIPLFV